MKSELTFTKFSNKLVRTLSLAGLCFVLNSQAAKADAINIRCGGETNEDGWIDSPTIELSSGDFKTWYFLLNGKPLEMTRLKVTEDSTVSGETKLIVSQKKNPREPFKPTRRWEFIVDINLGEGTASEYSSGGVAGERRVGEELACIVITD